MQDNGSGRCELGSLVQRSPQLQKSETMDLSLTRNNASTLSFPQRICKNCINESYKRTNFVGCFFFFFFFFLIINLKLLYGLGVVEKMLGTFSLAMLIGKAYQNHSLNYYAISGHLVSKMCLYINSINHYVSQLFFLVLRSSISA